MLRLKDFVGDKYVFLDFDGTLVPYRANKNTVHISEQEFIRQSLSLGGHLLDDLRVIQTFKQGVLELDPKRVYILSVVGTNIEAKAKDKFLGIHYPTILKEHVLYVGSSSYKAIVMEELYRLKFSLLGMSRSDLILVDDTLGVIQSVEAAGFSALHVSEFIE